jgi:lipopolysaccharide export system protein LptC
MARHGRWRVMLLLGLGIALVLASYWLLQVMQNGALVTAPEARTNEPDYYVEKFSYLRLSKTGAARYNVSGARMVHHPADDTFDITLPVVHNLSPTAPALTMRSQRAIGLADSSKIEMIDQVEADRPAAPGFQHFHLSSPYLLVLVDDDIIQTDRAVDITLGPNHLSGTGMLANNATRQLRLAERVRARFPPSGKNP